MKYLLFFVAFIVLSALILAAAILFPAQVLYEPFPVEENVSKPNKPNVLFIFADDQAFSTINAQGFGEVKTPNLDRLANQGMSFKYAYNQGGWNGALCIASRTMLNSGRFLWNANKLDVSPSAFGEIYQGNTWPQLMQRGGYSTYFTGKWHMLPTFPQQIYDYTAGVNLRGMPMDNASPDSAPWNYNRPQVNEKDPFDPSDKSLGGYWKGGTHWSERLANHVIEFLGHAANNSDPFFIFAAFNAPHDPRQAPKSFVDLYSEENIEVPESFLAESDVAELVSNERDALVAPYPRTKEAVRRHRKEYYAIISHMDQQIGRILEKLEATGKADNTIVVFTADQGLAVGEHGLYGKQNMFEHSVRTPFFIKGPNIKHQVIEERIYIQDIMPTILESAQIPIPDYVQFKSLMPLINLSSNLNSNSNVSTNERHHDAIYAGLTDTQRMVIKDNYKLIMYPTINKVSLFDLKSDPKELHDLVDQAGYKEIIDGLKKAFVEQQNLTGDSLNIGF